MGWTWWLVIIIVVVILLLLQRRRRRRRFQTSPPNNWQRDVVYLYMFKRAMTKGVVNLSPYAIKVETWLRLHKIKFEAVETEKFSPKRGQIPFVWLNGEWLEESSQIIVHLAEQFNINRTDGLTDEQVATSRAFTKMVEDHTAMIIFLYRYGEHVEEFSRVFQLSSSPWRNFTFRKVMKIGFKVRAHLQGLGRNTPEQNAEAAKEDIRALSRYLGGKQYFFGDKMTDVDCCIFGVLSQAVYVDMNYPHKEPLKEECVNLQRYMARIKDTLWPDWHQLCDVHSKFH